MERFIKVIRNKYFIAAGILVVWMTFFDRYDFPTQYSYQKEKAKLEYEKEFYTKEISNISSTIKDIKTKPSFVEKIAREKYKMKKDNEDIFIITTE